MKNWKDEVVQEEFENAKNSIVVQDGIRVTQVALYERIEDQFCFNTQNVR